MRYLNLFWLKQMNKPCKKYISTTRYPFHKILASTNGWILMPQNWKPMLLCKFLWDSARRMNWNTTGDHTGWLTRFSEVMSLERYEIWNVFLHFSNNEADRLLRGKPGFAHCGTLDPCWILASPDTQQFTSEFISRALNRKEYHKIQGQDWFRQAARKPTAP